MSDEPVRILHLSDFHFRRKTRWESEPILASLAESVGELVDAGLAPDIVAITGDVAFSGRSDEYARAVRWINTGLVKALPKGFRKSRILIVPGNHDIKRDAVKNNRIIRSLHEQLHKVPTDRELEVQDEIADCLTTPTTKKALLKSQRDYLRFVSAYGPRSSRLGEPWWTAVVSLHDGIRIRFSGLCSSWMSSSDSDRGKLLVGKYQVRHFPRVRRDGVPHVVLVHHPWDYLEESDAGVTEEVVHAKANLVLRGHLHRRKYRLVSYPFTSCIELEAGCAYENSDYPKAFNLVEIDTTEMCICVRCWAWSRESQEWMPDRSVSPMPPFDRVKFALANGRPSDRAGNGHD